MENIVLDKTKPFLIIGSSGQEKELTQEIVNKYNSIAINRSPFFTDIIFRYDNPNNRPSDLNACRYFCTHIKYKDYEKYQDNKCRFFDSEYKIISDKISILGAYRFTVTVALNYIAIVAPQSEVYLVGIDHSKAEYNDPSVRRFIEQYNDFLKLYQTDFNSKGWNLEYREIR